MMDGYGCGWGMAGMGLFGLLIVLALVALAVGGGVWLARRGSAARNADEPDAGDHARDRLRQLFAEGQVDEEEYERRLAVLIKDRPSS